MKRRFRPIKFFGSGFIGNRPGGGLIRIDPGTAVTASGGRTGVASTPIYFGCLKLITDRIRTMRYDLLDGDKVPLAGRGPVWVQNPNPFWDLPTLLSNTAQQVVHYGNAWWYPVFDQARRPVGMYLLPPNEVTPNYTVNGGIDPNYPWVSGGTVVRQPLFHLAYIPNPGDILGIGTLQAASGLIDLADYSLRWQTSFYKKGATGQFFVTTTGEQQSMNDQEIDRFQDTWQANVGGEGNAFRVPIIPGGLKLERVSLTAEQMDFISARKLTDREICAQIFHIDPSYFNLNDSGTSVTYSTMQALETRIWNDAVKPIATILEDAVSYFLTGNNSFRFRPGDYLLGTPNDRSNQIRNMSLVNKETASVFGHPVFTLGEIRDVVGLPSEVPEELLALEPPEPEPAPALPEPEEDEPEEDDDEEEGDEDDA